MKKFLIAVALIFIASAFRTVWHVAANVELVTLATFLAATYLGYGWAILVPLATMALTDKSIGTTNIFIFVWLAYGIIGLVDWLMIKKSGKDKIVLKQTIMALFTSVFFYLFTNFGVWALDEWGMYTRSLPGLINCYIMGIPFYRNNFVGNLILIPVGFWLIETVINWAQRLKIATQKIKT
ncbi:MAG TPA: DUF6580 family putative transport protein [Candidatus Bathyarchaeia archaeon]|nr:DUF6580 family putative transport protein [Candidatus Bathyarchaeia archaeon]